MGVFYLYNDDSINLLRRQGSNTVDSFITDPPAGISFLGKDWDSDRGGRDAWISWMTEIMGEAHRVHKPGGHVAVWTLPRTQHWTKFAIENAGFDIIDDIAHILPAKDTWVDFISSLNDEQYKEFVKLLCNHGNISHIFATGYPSGLNVLNSIVKIHGGDIPQNEFIEAIRDSNTGLKPAREDWVLARKRTEKVTSTQIHRQTGWHYWYTSTVIKNVSQVKDYVNQGYPPLEPDNKIKVPHYLFIVARSLHPEYKTRKILQHKNGQTLLEEEDYKDWSSSSLTSNVLVYGTGSLDISESRVDKSGNHPTNLVLYHSSQCQFVGGVWRCDSDCPVKNLSDQRGESVDEIFNTTIYQPKPSRAEKDNGLDHMPTVITGGMSGRLDGSLDGSIPMGKNTHPTVKPVNLMYKIIKMLTPPRGVVGDPFLGSGSTGVAATRGSWSFLGIEKETHSYEIAYSRIMWALREVARMGATI